MTVEQIGSAIRTIPVPGLQKTIGEAKFLRNVTPTERGWLVEIDLPTPAFPGQTALKEAIATAASQKAEPGQQIEVKITAQVRGKMTGGSIGLKAKNVIAVGSGKGGVGKSTVAAALAYGLKSFGCQVGLLDADVYGPSIPHMTGVSGSQPMATPMQLPDGKTITRIQPIEAAGIKLMSMGFFLKHDQAVVWRGPLLHRAITQFLSETEWGELDYLIIDLPPGTGDVALTLSQLLGLAGAVVVCTPQQVALLDAVKAISMYRQVKIPVLGIVENMSGDIFGTGGARLASAEVGIPFLGEIPMDAALRIAGDSGRMGAIYDADSAATQALRGVAEQTALQVVKELLSGPALPSLEIL